MFSDFKQDLVYGVRSLRRTPAFTAVALVTLALGIGANAAIFSVINSVLLRPLPYRDADRVVFLWSTSRGQPTALPPQRLIDFRERLTTLDGLAGISHLSMNLTGGGEPERLSASSVSSNFFDLLGVTPILGDAFHTNRANADDIVLSFGLWTRRFGSDRTIVGRTITLNGRARRVAAVMPLDFTWPAITARGSSNAQPPELWIPGASHDIPRTPSDDPNQNISADRRIGFLRAVGRLKAGATIAQAQAELDALAARLSVEHPREDANLGAVVQPIREQLFGAVRRPLLILMGAVGCVLAIACANAAGLLLGRATARRREIAMRLALGAGRHRIVRQLLTESMLLAFGGAAAGLLVAWWARSTLLAIAPANVPRLGDGGIDGSVLAFTLGVTIATGIVFGIVPAWQVSTGALTSDLNDGHARGSAGPRGTRTRDVLVAVQIAVALVLLVGAGLLLRSFTTLTRVDVGIETANLLTFDLVLSGQRAAAPPARIAFYTETLEAIRALPGVRAAGGAVTLPIGGDDFGTQYTVEGKPVPTPAEQPSAGFQIVTPAYFTTMGIPLVAGRDFHSSDTHDAQPVAIVNEALARQQWPGENPIGKRVRFGREADSTSWMTVVGLVGDVRHLGPATPPRPELYQPFTQNPFSWMAFVVRSAGDPRSLVPPIRSAIARLDAMQPISRVSTMQEHVERSLARPHFMSTLIGAFGGLALLLSIVGIYGVMAYSVAQRTREIAIRSALGARRSDVLRLVLLKALWLSVAGIVAGLSASAALTGVLSGQLYGVTPADPTTYALVIALLLVVAIAAGAIPAARAMRIEAATALK